MTVLAGGIRPSMEDSDAEFGRILELSGSPSGLNLPPYLAPSLRVQVGSPREPEEAAGSRIRCWMEGRIYNGRDLCDRFSLPEAATSAVLLASAHEKGLLDRMLPEVNGDFAAVLYDGESRRLTLCTDRLGLRPVYFLSRSPEFFFCTRLRGFLGVSGFSPRLSAAAVECFLDLGHLVGDQTWFEGVELLPPATLLEVDVGTARIAGKRRYWGWGGIKPRAIGIPEAADELRRLLKQAVSRRIFPGEKPAVLLSGGLDSRAILGCVPSGTASTATFGQAGCRDLLYAARAAKAAGASNIPLVLTAGNWDLNRFHAIWKCDGMSSPADLSGSQFLRSMRSLGSFNLNGFAGDLVAGGSYLDARRLDAPADAAFAARCYGKHAAAAPPEDAYFDAPHTDPYVLANRVRRLTLAGTREEEDQMEQRKPFMDSDLLEFLYSLPDGHRRNGGVYHRALLDMRPDLFAEIPWQKTGRPVSEKNGLPARLENRLHRMLEKRGWTRTPAEFQDVPRWLEASSGKYRSLLEGKGALWPAFVTGSYRMRFDWNGPRGPQRHRKLLQAAGLEIWLQQIFNGKHREPEVPET